MNRLWIRLSLATAFVVIIVSLTPMLARMLDQPPDNQKPMPREISGEKITEFEETLEKRVWNNFFRTMIVGGALALVAGVIVSRWLVSPLSKLEDGAMAVAEHKFHHRVPVEGSKEIQSVARSFNLMADELEEQENLRQNMLADVTHELRHPVHILQGNLRAMLDGIFPLDRKEITRLLEQTDQLSTLVDDLHQLALAEAKQLPLHKEKMDLVEVISTAIKGTQPMMSSKAIEVEFSSPDDPVMYVFDSVRIRQAFQNILINAFHHSPKKGLIKVGLLEGEEGIMISVKDSGSGISAEHLPHVFNRFYQADPIRSRENGGAGLGLAIAQANVQSHGGEITVESAGAGRGSTFRIKLP